MGGKFLKIIGYIVKAYDEQGQEMQQEWINTNVEEAPTPQLDKLGLKNYSISLHIRGCEIIGSETILELSRYHFVNGGIYNPKRNCYYPRDVTTAKGTAEYNKLEKLFRKWGFTSFH